MTGRARLGRAARIPLLALVLVWAVPCSLLALAGFRRAAMNAWCAAAARAVGLRVHRAGAAPEAGCLVVANHVGYLDILALGTAAPGGFLAMAEIARWPLLGALTRVSGALFVDRSRPRSAVPFLTEMEQRFAAGERILLFPEARVSPDGRTLGPFRPMLFEPCAGAGIPVVPVGIRYTRPDDPRVWAWIDEPNLWRHLWQRVLLRAPVEVEVRIGSMLTPLPGEDRKTLAERARREVSRLLDGGRTTSGGGEDR